MDKDEKSFSQKKAGIVAIAGRPNVGKSTFLNWVIREHISSVSFRPQTTIRPIRGIYEDERGQILFVDTPGIFSPSSFPLRKGDLSSFLLKSTFSILHDTDLILLMWDGTEIRKEDEELFTLLGREERTIWVVNKIDAVPPADKKKFQEEGKKRGKEVFLISSVTGEGILELLSHIFQLLPISPPLYPGDMVTDLTLREICAEYIREALFHHLREELPYECWVEIEEFLEEKDPVYIRAIIRTNRENQKKMVIGEDGKKIREIGIYARTLMEKLLGRKVYLDLWVKVDRGWKKKEPLLRHLTSLPSDKGWRTSPFYRRWLEKEK